MKSLGSWSKVMAWRHDVDLIRLTGRIGRMRLITLWSKAPAAIVPSSGSIEPPSLEGGSVHPGSVTTSKPTH